MSRRHRSAHPCPSPSKQRFASFDEAKASYQRNLANPVIRNIVLADWGYRCQCGAWHRTKRHDRFLGGVPLHD